MTLPDHLFIGDCGHLYDTRTPNWSGADPLRRSYRCTYREIKTVAQLKATLRSGQFAWPGGYQLYFVASDGCALSFEGVKQSLTDCYSAIKHRLGNGWRIVGCDVNYEDEELYCAHTGKVIPSAYGSDEEPSELAELREHLRYPLPGELS
jgi:hypothetical protein